MALIKLNWFWSYWWQVGAAGRNYEGTRDTEPFTYCMIQFTKYGTWN